MNDSAALRTIGVATVQLDAGTAHSSFSLFTILDHVQIFWWFQEWKEMYNTQPLAVTIRV